jgi:hypothetical protein
MSPIEHSEMRPAVAEGVLKKFEPVFLYSFICLLGVRLAYAALSIKSPIVIGDEFYFLIKGFYYSDLTQLSADMPQDAAFGASFYTAIVYLVSGLGQYTDVALKLINVMAVIATLLFCVRCWRLRPIGSASLVMLVLMVTPANLFATYTTPDLLYHCVFVAMMVAAVWLTDVNERHSWLLWPVFGFSCAVLCLLKPHGLFAVLGIAVAMLCACLVDHGQLFRARIKEFALFISVYAVCTLTFQYLVTGGKQDFVGQFYKGQLSNSTQFELSRLGQSAIISLTHFVIMLSFLAPAISYVLFSNLQFVRDKKGDPQRFRDCLILILPLIVAVGISVFVSWHFYWDLKVINLRYFSFLFPCIVIVCAATENRRGDMYFATSQRWRIATAVVWGATAILFWAVSDQMRILPYFAPEAFFAYNDKEFGKLNVFGGGGHLIGLAVVLCGCGILGGSRKVGWLRVQIGVLICLFVVANINVGRVQKLMSDNVNFYKDAGDMARMVCQGRSEPITAIATNEDISSHSMALYRVFGKARVVVVDDKNPAAIAKGIGEAKCVLSWLPLAIPGLIKIKTPSPYAYNLYIRKEE